MRDENTTYVVKGHVEGWWEGKGEGGYGGWGGFLNGWGS